MVPVILIAVGIILIALNLNAVLREKKSFREQLDLKQNEMGDYKIEIGKIRKEFAETVFELQKEIESLKSENRNNMNEVMLYNRSGKKTAGDSSPQKSSTNDSSYQKSSADAENSDEIESEINENNVKIDEVRDLLSKNMPVDEISQKTGIGKGEVLLIKELYTK
jgi:uncharacterized membrane-anchored protein YhcB (DUF1043 family)